MKSLSEIFPYGSDKDETFIKKKMWEWLKGINDGKDFRSYHQMLYDVLHKVNNGGKTIKYLHFSERNQRVYLHDKFLAWADKVSDKQSDLLESF
jgi:hypothetical protein